MSSARSFVRGLLAKSLLQDTLRLQTGQMLQVAINACRSLLALRLLGPTAYGAYAIAQSMVTSALVLDVTAASRVALIGTARALGEKQDGDPAGPLADLLRLCLAAAMLLAAGLWWLAPPIAGRAFGDQAIGQLAGWLGLSLVVDVPATVAIVALQATRKMTATVVFETVRAGVWLVAVVGALSVSATAPALVAAQLAVSVLACPAAVVVYRRLARNDPRLPGWSLLLRRTRERDSRPALAQGVRIAVDKNIQSLGSQLPILLLGVFDAAAVGLFEATLKVMALPAPLLTGLARNLEVVFPHRAAAGLDALRSLFVRVTRVAAVAWVPVTGLTALAAPMVLTRLLGAAYAPAVMLIPAAAAQSLVLGAGVGMGAVFRTTNRVGRSILCQLVALVVTAPIGVWLISAASAIGAMWFHAIHVGLATTLSLLVVLSLLRPVPAERPDRR